MRHRLVACLLVATSLGVVTALFYYFVKSLMGKDDRISDVEEVDAAAQRVGAKRVKVNVKCIELMVGRGDGTRIPLPKSP